MKITFSIQREVNVSKDVCLWNTWDHEHLYYVHKQFGEAKIIYEDSNVAFIQTKVKVPFLPVWLRCLHTMTSMKDGNVLVVDTLPFGVISKLEMIYIELGPKKTRLINNYEINLPGVFYFFHSTIKKIISKWNEINWSEDLPLKLRRQLSLDSGFIDFYGKSDRLNMKKIKLPIPRTKDSILN